MSWASEEGFPIVMQELADASGQTIEWESAQEFRQRHVINAVRAMAARS